MKLLLQSVYATLTIACFASHAISNVIVHNDTRQFPVYVTCYLNSGKTIEKEVSPDLSTKTALIAPARNIQQLNYRVGTSSPIFTQSGIPTAIDKPYPDAFREHYTHHPGADTYAPHRYDAILHVHSNQQPAQWTIGEK